MFNIIYKILWVVLVILAIFCDALKWMFNFCKVKLKNIALHLLNNRISEISLLEECKNDLTKIPKHLSIIIGRNVKVSAEVLSKLAVYALIYEIDFISFYDTNNKFSLDQIKIPQFISSQKIQNGRFLWSMPRDKNKSGQLKYKNGLERSIQVVTLSSRDGRPLLAEVCKELCLQKESDEMQIALKDKTILAEKITTILQKKLNNLPDPELVVIFDKTMCTFGLLPWNTGFSEFHLVKNGEFFNVQEFVNVLCKFSKCEQRFGK